MNRSARHAGRFALAPADSPLEQAANRAADRALAPPVARRAALPDGAMRDAAPAQFGYAPASVECALDTPGAALGAELQQDMEQRFGHDFSRVRVHADAAAAASARDIRAHAYTVGRNIVFGAGRFRPGVPEGRRLIAHELAHVVQHAGGADAATVRRFESPEHQDFGDKGGVDLAAFLATPEGKQWLNQYTVNPAAVADIDHDPLLKGKKIVVGTLELSAGDAIALVGDFYRSPRALMAAPPAEVAELLATIKRERAGALSGANANEAYQDITAKYRKSGDTFLDLAKVNKPHFTPGNRAEWTRLHKEAIATAREARLRPAALQEALLIDAGAGHFLTDAFAAGHLFDKDALEVQIDVYIGSHPPRPANPEMQGYFALSGALGVMPSLVLKNIHDRLNREGVEVRNKKGMTWRSYGDDNLKRTPETLRIGALAIYISRQQVMRAGVAEPDPAEVLDLLPDDDSVARATASAIKYIPGAAADVAGLIYRQRGGVKAGIASSLPPLIGPVVGKIIESNISAIGNPGREKQLLELEDRRRRRDGPPEIAPQFTVLEF